MSRGTPVARKQYILTAPGCYRGPPRQRPHISNGMEPFEFIVLDCGLLVLDDGEHGPEVLEKRLVVAAVHKHIVYDEFSSIPFYPSILC